MKPKGKVYIWLTVNFLGMGVYLFFASALWVAPEDQGMPGGPGDAFVWLFTLVPVIVLFSVINLVALVRATKEFLKNRNLVPVLLWIIVLSVWLNVFLFDHLKSVRFIDSSYAQEGASAVAPKAARH